MAIQTPVELGVMDDTLGTSTHNFTVPAGGVPLGALLLVRGFTLSNFAPFTSVTDTQSNSYSIDLTTAISSPSRSVNIASCVVAHALTSSDTITIHNSGTFACSASFAYVTADSGWRATPLDKTAGSTNTTSPYSSSSTSTTSQTQEFLAGLVEVAGGSISITPDSPWVSEQNTFVQFGGDTLCTTYQIVSATGAYANTGTETGTAWASLIATYESVYTPPVLLGQPDGRRSTFGPF